MLARTSDPGRERKARKMASIICRNGEKHYHESVQLVKVCWAGRNPSERRTAKVHALDCGLQGSGLNKSCTCEVDNPKRTVEHVNANRYAGVCASCFEPVGEREGRLVKNDGNGNGYRVLHLAGQCPRKAPANTRRVTGPTARDFSAVLGGYYATISATGNNDFDFWFVKEGRKPGYRFVKRYIGGSGPIRITGMEALRALETILAEGVDICGDRFADEHCRCRDCGLPLTDETSRAARRGPICRNK